MACLHCPSDALFRIPIFFEIYGFYSNMQTLAHCSDFYSNFLSYVIGAVPVSFQYQKENRNQNRKE